MLSGPTVHSLYCGENVVRNLGRHLLFCSQISPHNAIRDEFGTSLSMNFGKASSMKFPSFVYVCITREKSYHFRGKSGNFFRGYTNIYRIWKLRTATFLFTTFRIQTLQVY